MAFRQLHDRFSSRLFAIAINILHSREEAEDVVQEGFHTVWRRAGNFDPSYGQASAWIGAILRHRAIDALRSRGLRRRRIEESFQGRNDPWITSTGATAVMENERHQLVQAAMAALSAMELRTITLVFWKGLSHSEAATFLGIPLGTAKARIRRVQIKLRLILVQRRRSREIAGQLAMLANESATSGGPL